MAREAQHKLIEDPITLKIVENKLESGEYLSAYHFARDIRKIISNAFLINATDPESFLQVFEFSTLFESLFKGHKDLFLTENAMQNLQSKIENLSQNIKDLQQKTPQAKLVKEKKMTPVEKKQLCQSIRKLDPKYFNGMLKIIKTCMNPQGNNLEFDIEKLPEKVCRELEKYIKQCLQVKPQRKKGPEVLKTELVMEDLAKPEQEIRSESSESSSSSSESEDEMPGPPIYSDSWDRDFNDYSNATIIDFDKY